MTLIEQGVGVDVKDDGFAPVVEAVKNGKESFKSFPAINKIRLARFLNHIRK